MYGYVVDMVLCGVVYLMLVYFMFVLMRKRQSPSNGRDPGDDGNGGWKLPTRPKIDLPPGVLWPDGSGNPKKTKKEEKEELVY
jgi:hypothetical protein